MATAYTMNIPSPSGLPESLNVRVVGMRNDGKALTREDLTALAALYPPTSDESRKAVEASIKRARKSRTKV